MKATGERFIPESMKGDIEIEHFHRYETINDIVKDKIVLDAASGTGYGSYILSKTAKSVNGIDISEEAVEYANINYKKANIKFEKGSIEKLNFPDNYFDVVVSFETIEHVDEEIQNKFLKEINRVLKDDGILIMSTPNKKTYSDDINYKNEYHLKEFYEEEFINFIKKEFDEVDIYYQYFSNVSILTKYNKDTLRTINFDDNNRGIYFVVIASKKQGKIIDNISSVYSYSIDELKKYDYLQVFYKLDSNFNEKNSIKSYIKKDIKKISKNINMDNILAKFVRIDPMTQNCILKINSIVVEFDDSNKKDYSKYIITNAEIKNKDCYIFLNNDPQIYISFSDLRCIKSISLDIDVIDTDIDANIYYKQLSDLLESKENYIKDIEETLKSKEAYIKETLESKENYIKDIEETLKTKESYISEIENSRGWILLTKVKKIMGK